MFWRWVHWALTGEALTSTSGTSAGTSARGADVPGRGSGTVVDDLGRWVLIGSEGVRVAEVGWDPVIARYSLNGQVWADTEALREVMGDLEAMGWEADGRVRTEALRVGLGL